MAKYNYAPLAPQIPCVMVQPGEPGGILFQDEADAFCGPGEVRARLVWLVDTAWDKAAFEMFDVIALDIRVAGASSGLFTARRVYAPGIVTDVNQRKYIGFGVDISGPPL